MDKCTGVTQALKPKCTYRMAESFSPFLQSHSTMVWFSSKPTEARRLPSAAEGKSNPFSAARTAATDAKGSALVSDITAAWWAQSGAADPDIQSRGRAWGQLRRARRLRSAGWATHFFACILCFIWVCREKPSNPNGKIIQSSVNTRMRDRKCKTVTREIQCTHSKLVETLQHRHGLQCFYVPYVDGRVSANLEK